MNKEGKKRNKKKYMKQYSMFEYKNTHTLEQRKKETETIIRKFPNRIPIICEVANNTKKKITLDKNKYLVPNDITMGQFLYVIRKKIKMLPEESLFMFINNKIPLTSQLISEIYRMEKEEDGFLYVQISMESTFG